MLSKRDLLELQTIIAAYQHIGVPYTDLVFEVKENGITRQFATPFIMDIYKKNQETMSKLKQVWQEAP